MDPLLRYCQSRRDAQIELIRRLVEIESPSDDKAAVDRMSEFLADRLAPVAAIRVHRRRDGGNHLRVEFRLPGNKKSGQVLVLGHVDTVWPVGTLARMPFRAAEGRLWGPGVFDMKTGIAIAVFAAAALRELDRPLARKLVLQLNADEEVGSESSRAITEAEARKSAAVLVLEPSVGLDGKVKTARKGVGDYMVRVKGRAAHAGLDFEAGASATLELARQLLKIAAFTDLERGITVNPGVIGGGTRTNVVAEEAWAKIDLRVWRLADARRIGKKFRALRPVDRRTSFTIEGGLNRPPLERSPDVVRLYRRAQRIAAEMGVELGEAQVGGGSDGNFTAALGVPTLDGLGAVGEGAHAANESVLISRLADRTALVARLIESL
ncbi:MAG TPA: M20 family metallopeptidase [Bryobacterales bacterium]|nr:M20 family metallopeptidase [Bryobacterales bacterium]